MKPKKGHNLDEKRKFLFEVYMVKINYITHNPLSSIANFSF